MEDNNNDTCNDTEYKRIYDINILNNICFDILLT